MKVLLEQLPPLFARGSSGMVAGMILTAIAVWRGESMRVPQPLIGRLHALSMTNVFAWMGFSTLSMQWLDAGQAAMLVYTMPNFFNVAKIFNPLQSPEEDTFAASECIAKQRHLSARRLTAIWGGLMKANLLVTSSLRWALSICTVVCGLMLQSPAWAYFVSADTQFTWLNSTFTTTEHGIYVPPSSILSGASGDASSFSGSLANTYFDYSSAAIAVQEYGVFHAEASTHAHRDSPGNDYEAFQTLATGTFDQILTIAAPVGISDGSTGSLMLGWDITGSASASASGSAYLQVLAKTGASLPNTNSSTVAIMSDGHYQLINPIAFAFGEPFQLTLDTSVQANVGYDFRSTVAPASFSSSIWCS